MKSDATNPKIDKSPDDDHFAFGENWTSFLSEVDDARITAAENSLRALLGTNDLSEQTFLDAGCGSGLFSLAATRLGAKVTSFDLDPQSVACATELKHRYKETDNWRICSGSLTDQDFLQSLGTFDVIYCWGVAHHTGKMWPCIENLLPLTGSRGKIVLAIYNDQLYISRGWAGIKSTYQRLPRIAQPILVILVGAWAFLQRLCTTILAILLRAVTLRNPTTPIKNWIQDSRKRGMNSWHDLVDWVGGWPFEVARPEEVFCFVRDRGFILRELSTSLGHGCNEFVFQRSSAGEK